MRKSKQPAAPASSAYRWLVVAMLWAISLFNYGDRQAVFSVFPLLQREMRLDPVQLGLLAGAFAWVYGLGGQFAGMLVDRISRRRAILGGLYVWSGICVATPLARGFSGLLALRAAEGLGETFYYPAAVSMLSDYHGPATRSRALGLHQTSVYAGTIAGGFFAAWIGERYGWRWSFLVFGGLGVLLGLLLQRYLREPVRGAAEGAGAARAADEPIAAGETLRIIWTTPVVFLLMAAFVCANFVAVVLLSWMPSLVYEKFHLSLAMAGLTATLFVQVASMAGSAAGGWLADRMQSAMFCGRVVVQAAGVLCGAPFVVVCGLTGSVEWLIGALTAWGFFKGLYDANIFASVYDVVPVRARGAAAGFMNTVGWAGGGVAPVLVGVLARRHGLGFGIAGASVVYLAAGGILVVSAVTLRRTAGITKQLLPVEL